MPKILIIEDDPLIVEAVGKTLSLERAYALRAVSEGEKALAAAISYKPDLILLDIGLPGVDGRQIIRCLKDNAVTAATPVIFLTGMSSEGDKVLGLNLGADDYVVKPFGAMELLARIQAVLRRVRPENFGREVVKAGGLRIDAGGRVARFQGAVLKLQPKEFEILYLLASHAGKTLSRAYLIENTSSYGMEVSTRSLDTHIKNIRKKLGSGSRRIETVSKMGYRFAVPDA